MSSGNLLYRYACWGLNICSEMECPELLKGSGEADVFIRVGKTPEELPSVKIRGVCFQMNEEQFLLKVAGVANYWVRGGREIVIEPLESTGTEDIRLFLLGSAFGALLHQRGLPPFHGSAVAMGGRAVLFVGPSTAGKSTLAAELCRRGHSLLADDVCALRQEEGPPSVLPAYPRTKLWRDALEALQTDRSGLSRVRAELDKYSLPLEAAFCSTALPLHAVYILCVHNDGAIKVEPVVGQAKFAALNDNTYRPRFIEGLGDKTAHYLACASMAKHARVALVRRPREPFLLRELAGLIERECR